MIIKGYKIDWTFAMLAMSFVMAAIVSKNFAFMGGVIICLIFGIKKIKNNSGHSDNGADGDDKSRIKI